MTFLHLLEEDQKHWVQKNLPPGADRPFYAVYPPAAGHKRIARRFMEEAGLAVPYVHAAGISLAEVMRVVSRTPRCFVKPEHGWGAVATMGFVNAGTKFLNTLSGEERTLDNWRRHLRAERRRFGLRDRWMVEELLARPGTAHSPPDEYKFYAFAGRIELICVRRATWNSRAGAVFRWADAEWNPVETGAYPEHGDDTLPLLQGEEREAFVEAAKQVSRTRCIPFTRVDLYRTGRGIVGGELTLLPGAAGEFSEQWQRRLTAAWYETANCMAESIRRGSLRDVIELSQRILEETGPVWRGVVHRERLRGIQRRAKSCLRPLVAPCLRPLLRRLTRL